MDNHFINSPSYTKQELIYFHDSWLAKYGASSELSRQKKDPDQFNLEKSRSGPLTPYGGVPGITPAGSKGAYFDSSKTKI